MKPVALSNLQILVPSNNETMNNTSSKNSTSATLLGNVLSSIQPDDPTDPEQVVAAVLTKNAILKTSKEEEEQKEKSAEAEPTKVTAYNEPVGKTPEEIEAEKEQKSIRQKVIRYLSNFFISAYETLKIK